MKYILLTSAALILCFGLSFLVAGLIRKTIAQKAAHKTPKGAV